MSFKDEIRARLTQTAAAASKEDIERMQNILGTTDIHYIRYGNKFRLFIIDNGKLRSVTQAFGRFANVKWKDDSQGGWINTRGGDPVFSMEAQIEPYVPGLRLHEISRI